MWQFLRENSSKESRGSGGWSTSISPALGQCLCLITFITVRGTNSNLLFASLTDCELSLESLLPLVGGHLETEDSLSVLSLLYWWRRNWKVHLLLWRTDLMTDKWLTDFGPGFLVVLMITTSCHSSAGGESDCHSHWPWSQHLREIYVSILSHLRECWHLLLKLFSLGSCPHNNTTTTTNDINLGYH